MEKIRHTKEEKELLELCAYLKMHYSGMLPIDSSEKEFYESEINSTDLYIQKVNEVAEHRRNYNQTKIDREQKKWDNYRDADCPKCKKTTSQKPKGEMRNDKNWRMFLFYCPYCNTNHGDWYPIEEKDQLKWIDNFIEQSLLVKEDGTTIAEKLSMTQESIEQSKKDREEVARYVREMKDWEEKCENYYKLTAAFINKKIKSLKSQKNTIESLRRSSN